jgi:Tfp pilus assembly protein PilF
MRNRDGSRGIGVLAAVLALGGVTACGDDAVDRLELALTAAEPAPVATPAVPTDTYPVIETTPVVETKAQPTTVVSYDAAEAAYRSGRHGDAVELFTGYVATRPANAHGHYMLGLSSWRAGDSDGAERALARAVELDGTNVRARTNLARVLLEQRRAADAVVHLEAALAVDMGAHEVWRVLGNAYAQLGSTEAALDAYREALVLHGDDAWSMNNYGLVLIQLSLFDDAVPPLARAIELVPGSATFQNNLGVALERIGELAAAARAFEAALVADDGHDRARTSLARVRARLDAVPEFAGIDLAAAARDFTEQVARWREGLDREGEGCLH